MPHGLKFNLRYIMYISQKLKKLKEEAQYVLLTLYDSGIYSSVLHGR